MDMYQFARWGEDLDREFQGTSDRAAALVGAAMLDAQLKTLFEARIARNTNRSQLFDGTNAALHSFSGKADLAVALGMISQREYRNVTLIRRIRNVFAHKLGELSFATPEIASRCDELEIPIGMRLPTQIPSPLIADKNSDPSELRPVQFDTPRDRFQAAVVYVSSCFHGRLIELMGTEPKPRPEYERSSEILELLLSGSDMLKEGVAQRQTEINELRERYAKLEGLLEDEKADEETKRTVIDLRDHIEKLQVELANLEHSEAQTTVELLTGPMLQALLGFIRRWESWVEGEEPPL